MMRSLRSRLILGIFLGMAGLLMAMGLIIYTVQRHQLYRAFDETLSSSVHSLMLLFRPGPGGIEFDSTRLEQLSAGQLRQGALFQLWSNRPLHSAPSRPDSEFPPREPRGRPERGSPPRERGATQPSDDWNEFDEFDEFGDPPSFRPPPPPESRERRPFGQSVTVIRSSLLGEADLPRLETSLDKLRFEMIRLPDGSMGRGVGLRFRVSTSMGPGGRRNSSAELTAVVAAGTAELDRQLHFLIILLAVTALGAMTVSGGVAWFSVSRGLRPLAIVARRISTMDEMGLKQRLSGQDVPQEIEPVVKQLNGLLGRLDEAFERERLLTADVAHELRTPVAEIRTIAEITLKRLRHPDEYQEAMKETLEVAQTLQGLIETLLILARLESGHMEPELDFIAVEPILAQHWAQVRGNAEQRGLVFEDRCSPNTMVTVDPKLLSVILSNVLLNAVTYTPEGGRITVDAQCWQKCCILHIANTGCPMNPNDVDKVFDRFWRADAARSGQSRLNCGLGLPLVRRAMEAMGGKADATMSQDHCFVLTLTFDTEESSE